jgi:hypothetical protein
MADRGDITNYWLFRSYGEQGDENACLWLHAVLSHAKTVKKEFNSAITRIIRTFVAELPSDKLDKTVLKMLKKGLSLEHGDFSASIAPVIKDITASSSPIVALAAQAIVTVLCPADDAPVLPRWTALTRVLVTVLASTPIADDAVLAGPLYRWIAAHLAAVRALEPEASQTPQMHLLLALLQLSHNTRALKTWFSSETVHADLIEDTLSSVWSLLKAPAPLVLDLQAPDAAPTVIPCEDSLSLALDTLAQFSLAPLTQTVQFRPCTAVLDAQTRALCEYMPVSVRTVASTLLLWVRWAAATGPYSWVCNRLRSILIGAVSAALITNSPVPTPSGAQVTIGGNVALHWLMQLSMRLTHGDADAFALAQALSKQPGMAYQAFDDVHEPQGDAIAFSMASQGQLTEMLVTGAAICLSETALLVLSRRVSFTKLSTLDTADATLASIVQPLVGKGSLAIFYERLPQYLSCLHKLGRCASALLASNSTAAIVQYCLASSPMVDSDLGSVVALSTVITNLEKAGHCPSLSLNSPHSSLVHTIDALLPSSWMITAPATSKHPTDRFITTISCQMSHLLTYRTILDAATTLLNYSSTTSLHFSGIFSTLQPLMEVFLTHSTVEYNQLRASHDVRGSDVASYVTGDHAVAVAAATGVAAAHAAVAAAASSRVLPLQRATYISATSASPSLAAALPMLVSGWALCKDVCMTLQKALYSHADILQSFHMPIISKFVRILMRFHVHGVGSERVSSALAMDEPVYHLSRLLLQTVTVPRVKDRLEVNMDKANPLRRVVPFVVHILSDYISLTKLAIAPISPAHWRVLRTAIHRIVSICEEGDIRSIQHAQDDAGRQAILTLLDESKVSKTDAR